MQGLEMLEMRRIPAITPLYQQQAKRYLEIYDIYVRSMGGLPQDTP